MIAGFGFRAEASVDSLQDALTQTGEGRFITSLATAEDKAQAPAFQALARMLNLPVVAVPAGALETAETRTQSIHSATHRATGSVAEAAALSAAGPDARLVVARTISHDRMATCAIATGDK